MNNHNDTEWRIEKPSPRYSGYDLVGATLTGLYLGLLLHIASRAGITVPIRLSIAAGVTIIALWAFSIALLAYVKGTDEGPNSGDCDID